MRAASGISSTGEAVGVALAVPALVAGPHNRGEVREDLDARHQLAADRGVGAHRHPLLIVQRPRLEQDLTRHRDLAEVVQHRCRAHVARLGGA